ncbi:hypothetical protein Tco_0498976 [Tanacetum coccineum]
MAALKFAETHNLVAFLEKPDESDGFEQIVDFLNASSIRYTLTVNPTIYTSCIKQFWATAKVKTVNGEVQIQALVDGKKVIVTKASMRRDLQLADENGTDCLPTTTIFEQLSLMGYEKISQKLTFYKAFFSPQWKYLIHIILQCLSAKTTAWNEFSSTMASAIICLATNQKFNFSKYIFDNMVKNLEGGVKFLMYPRFVQVFLDKQVGDMYTHNRTYDAPHHTKKIFANMKREGKGSTMPTDPQHTPTITQPSTSQPQKKQSQRKQRKNTEVPQPSGPTEPITDDAANEEHEDASKQGRKIDEIDQHAEVTLVDETQRRYSDNLMFDTGVLDNEEVFIGQDMEKKEVDMAEKDVSTVDPVTTTEIKSAKPKAVTTAATTTTTAVTRPKARGVIVQEPSEFTTTTSPSQPSQLPQAKDKGKAKMVEPEKPLKKKDQIMYDQEVALNLLAQLQAELEEEDRLSRQKEEEANIALIESWNNVQAMIEVDRLLAERLQAREQEELTDEEKARLFVELLEKRKKHFATLRAREKRNKPPIQAEQRKLYCNYLKNMKGYTLKQLKGFKFEVIKDMFDKAFKRVNTFVDYKTELVEGSEKKAEDSTKRTGTKLEQEVAKKQRIDDAKVDDDKKEAEMKKHMEIVPDEEEIAVDAIPLATKPPIIVDWKIIKKGKIGYFQIIRADGSSKRPEEAYEKVLWGDLKVMFEPDVESEVWRNLQGYKVTVWKLFDSRGVHFVRFQNMHIFMLVEKRYPLTPLTITDMLNKKLQIDQWDEMSYQLLKLITKQLKNPRSV